MQAARDRQTPEERAAHNLAVKVAKKALGHITSAQVLQYYDTATPEQLAAHALAISNTKTADGEQIGATSHEVWSRPGMNEFISGRIKEGTTEAWERDRASGGQRSETQRANVEKQFSDPGTAERHRQACIARDARDGGLKARYADPVQRAQIIAKRNATAAANRAAKKAAAAAGEKLL